MSDINRPINTLGVVVGRFQTPYLHDGHLFILNKARGENEGLLIVVGVPAFKGTKADPLPFAVIRGMLLNTYPNAMVVFIEDTMDHSVWSIKLDELIRSVAKDQYTGITLYGSRDSFLSYYNGQYKTSRVDQITSYSASQIREEYKDAWSGGPDFREGVVHSTQNQYDAVKLTVDCAAWQGEQLLLIRKKDEPAWRLPGGFVDGGDSCLEVAARREVEEETDLAVEGMRYIGSYNQPDWRLKGNDSLFTVLYDASIQFGRVKAKDDAYDARLFNIGPRDITRYIVESHRHLVEAALKFRGIK